MTDEELDALNARELELQALERETPCACRPGMYCARTSLCAAEIRAALATQKD